MEATRQRHGLERFNALPREQAEAELMACCAAPTWAGRVAARRPYVDAGALLAAAEDVRDLDDADVGAALAAHPRIGERATGDPPEAASSRREQAGMDAAADDVRVAMAEGNVAYEQRFDRVFLICASGRSAEEMLAALRGRLGNDDATERRVVAEELSRITRLRLEKLVSG
jgi:2-oxo-4-hydroxy-4-carboxy-5-ureidoimidazoline decarboxylase